MLTLYCEFGSDQLQAAAKPAGEEGAGGGAAASAATAAASSKPLGRSQKERQAGTQVRVVFGEGEGT